MWKDFTRAVRFFVGADAQQPGETEMQGKALTYDDILREIKTIANDPMAGQGKWSKDEELANQLFKRFKLADPARVIPVETPAAS